MWENRSVCQTKVDENREKRILQIPSDLHTSVLIPFIQPVGVFSSPLTQRHGCIHTEGGGLAECCGAVIPRCRNPAPSRVKRPLVGTVRGPVPGGLYVERHSTHGEPCPGPADWSAAACWPLALQGAFWIIIMLLRCHLQHQPGSSALTCERLLFPPWLSV